MLNNYKLYSFLKVYRLVKNGKILKEQITNWRSALLKARILALPSIFEEKTPYIEILNIWTGEIITLAEAEKRAKPLKGS